MQSSRKIEKIQERSLRYIYNDFESSYKSLMERSNKSLLYVNRTRLMMQYVFKIINGNVPMYLKQMYIKDDIIHNTRCHIRLKQPKYNSFTYGYNSVGYQGSRIWNALPNDMKEAVSLSKFKTLISNWKGKLCLCKTCPECKLTNP